MAGKADRQTTGDEDQHPLGAASDEETLDYIGAMTASLETICLRRGFTVLAGLLAVARQIASGIER